MDRQKRRALFGIVEQKFEKVEGTLRDQITLHQGESFGEDDTWIWHILEQVGLDSTFRQIPGGLMQRRKASGCPMDSGSLWGWHGHCMEIRGYFCWMNLRLMWIQRQNGCCIRPLRR